MKTLLALFLLSIAGVSQAESCSFSIKDNFGYELESIVRSSYSRQAACSDAEYACRLALSDGQRNGMYYDAFCEESYGPINPDRPPYPPTAMATCTTDLVDYYGNTIRSFSGSGRTQYEACGQSEQFCNYELSRGDSNGRRCVTRNGGGGGNYPRPPRETTESCRASRFDPSGMFIESYIGTATGPIGTNVKGEACRRANDTCLREIRGRQTCRIDG